MANLLRTVQNRRVQRRNARFMGEATPAELVEALWAMDPFLPFEEWVENVGLNERLEQDCS